MSAAPADPAPPASEQPLTFAVLGDSIAYGQGAGRHDETPGERLAVALRAAGLPVRVRMFAVPGARSAGLAEQVNRALPAQVDVALIVIGANDLTHFVPIAMAAGQLGACVATLVAAGVHVVVAPAPDLSVVPWLPPVARPLVQAASRSLHIAQARAAQAAGAVVVDLSDDARRFATDTSLYSADHFHPSSAGYAIIADALAPHVLAAARRARR